MASISAIWQTPGRAALDASDHSSSLPSAIAPRVSAAVGRNVTTRALAMLSRQRAAGRHTERITRRGVRSAVGLALRERRRPGAHCECSRDQDELHLGHVGLRLSVSWFRFDLVHAGNEGAWRKVAWTSARSARPGCLEQCPVSAKSSIAYRRRLERHLTAGGCFQGARLRPQASGSKT